MSKGDEKQLTIVNSAWILAGIFFSASEWRATHTAVQLPESPPPSEALHTPYTGLCPLNDLQDSLMTTTSSAGTAVIE